MERIVLFDGVCNYCNAMVNFAIRHDTAMLLRFATLQSETGKRLLRRHSIGEDIDSVVFIEDEKAYLHSTAGLRIAKNLGGIWPLSYALIVIPAPVRDWAYKLFAKHRYRLFGRTDACMIPTPEVKERFLS